MITALLCADRAFWKLEAGSGQEFAKVQAACGLRAFHGELRDVERFAAIGFLFY
jgi:hypothetical protein